MQHLEVICAVRPNPYSGR